MLGLAVFNGLFLVAAILVRPRLGIGRPCVRDVLAVPAADFNTMLLLVASTIGATVTPWMIFFQQSASADKGLTPHDVRHGRWDTIAGGVLAAVFGCGALIAGSALAGHSGSSDRGARRRRLPGAAAGRSRAARSATRVRARADRGGRGRAADDLGEHRLRGRRVHRRVAQLQQLRRAAPPRSTARTSAPR